ncbi:MAG TPA: division/cell wall cluster transcriptional repressor MraZ [Vicinamibacterales bacterium]
MLRGNHPAKIDEKGRLKIPTPFRTFIEAEWKTNGVYVTCDDSAGQYVRVYPLPVWEAIEARLSRMPSTDPARRRFQRWTSLYGQSTEIDAQGRVLIHPLLREPAAMHGEVYVLGQTQFLEVWNRERFHAQSEEQRLTDEDYRRLSEFGI